MADEADSSSDEEEMAKLKEATQGVLPSPIDHTKKLSSKKEDKKNDFPARKLTKMLDDMLEYYDQPSPEITTTQNNPTKIISSNSIKLLSSSKESVTEYTTHNDQ